MIQFDEVQAQVFALSPARHARIIGAPGTGKTKLLVETARLLVEERNWKLSDLLIISPNRTTSTHLRAALEAALTGIISGTPVRTAPSFAFSLHTRFKQKLGEESPILMTGATQDDLLRQVLETVDNDVVAAAGFRSEIIHSQSFRTELRTFWSVLDDFNFSPQELKKMLKAPGDKTPKGGDHPDFSTHYMQWTFAAHTIDLALIKAHNDFPAQITANSAMRMVSKLVNTTDVFAQNEIPQLVLVDDAGELSEGALGVLSALVKRGSRVWFFGDPDTATSAFQGEGTSVLHSPSAEFQRRGVHVSPHFLGDQSDQTVNLSRVYRHGPSHRDLITTITQRIGTSGVGQQRSAVSVWPQPDKSSEEFTSSDTVQFASVSSVSEQIGVVAHRLRRRHLGDDDGKQSIDWSRMAVLCRSNAEAQRAAAMLEHLQVPTMQASGGIDLRENQLVQHLIMILRHALELDQLCGDEIRQLLLGPLGGLDAISLRRLQSALILAERKRAFHTKTAPRKVAELFEISLREPSHAVDTVEGRVLRRLIEIIGAGAATHKESGTPRETLWSIWHTAGMANQLQKLALKEQGQRSADAHKSLDAVLSLFFILQRHEEQNSTVPLQDLLSEVAESAVPQDTLAAKSERDAVTVTTPQGVIGREFSIVCVLGPQEGSWPNMRSRGSILGTHSLERWLRGQTVDLASRQETLHDELRLFAAACSRSIDELCVVAVSNDEEFPSAFFRLGDAYETTNLPSSGLTLRGKVAELRKRVTVNNDDAEAAQTLALFAALGVAGADPEQWYGVAPFSTENPLVDLANDPELHVSVSPSQIQSVEDCPLNWAISHLGGGSSNTAADIGTLVHHILETVRVPDLDQMREMIDSEWSQLEFDAEWEGQKSRKMADAMLGGVTDYLLKFETTTASLFAAEAKFTLECNRAVLRGQADRLEMRLGNEGTMVPVVVDLKTGRNVPSQAEVADHAQLLAYQLGLLEGVFTIHNDVKSDGNDSSETRKFDATGGASLVFVHPQAQLKHMSFREYTQEPLTAEQREHFVDRVSAAAELMAGAEFHARVEHHCTSTRFTEPCQIHIIPAVSYA